MARKYLGVTVWSAIVVCLATVRIGESKPTPGDQSLCVRFPTAAFCRNKRQPNLQRDDDDTARYCAKWEKHYEFYCTGLGIGDRRASNFCPYYKTTCKVKAKLNAVTPPPLPRPQSTGNFFVQPSSANNGNSPQPLPTPAPAPVQPKEPLFPRWKNQPQSQAQVAPASNTAGQIGRGGLGSIGQPLGFLGGQNSAVAGTPFGVPGGGNSPLSIGQGFGAGPFANAFTGTNVNPLGGVNTGTSINAVGLPISAYRGVNFGGLIPGGLSNLFGR